MGHITKTVENIDIESKVFNSILQSMMIWTIKKTLDQSERSACINLFIEKYRYEMIDEICESFKKNELVEDLMKPDKKEVIKMTEEMFDRVKQRLQKIL